jgi:CMP-N,N'-diacetyllegionaminic acid synthase
MESCVAVISARGGSKGIPAKNIQPVAGKPLIAWTILASRDSGLFQRIVVSTDSQNIAATARHFGAEVPFMRPAELAADDTPGVDPVLHAVRWLETQEQYTPEWVMLLQPTSPLRSSEDIREAFSLAQEKNADAVVSVTAVHEHPYWMKRIGEDGRLEDFVVQERPVTRRQDLPAAYALNGAIYLVRRRILIEQETLFPLNTHALIMPRERSLDVDTRWDLYVADLILNDGETRR